MRESFDRPGSPAIRGAASDISDLAHTGNCSGRPHSKEHAGLVILLVDKRGLFRYCLASALCAFSDDIDVVSFSSTQQITSAYSDVTACILAVGSLVVTDHDFAADLSHLSSTLPSIPIIILADSAGTSEVAGALKRGVRGYLQSDLELRIMVEAIRLIGRGGVFVLAQSLLRVEDPRPLLGARDWAAPLVSVRQPTSVKGELRHITPREHEVLSGLRQGKLNKQIAYALNMSECTVKAHVQSILRKLGATNRTHLSFLANSLLSYDSPELTEGAESRATTERESGKNLPTKRVESFMHEADGI